MEIILASGLYKRKEVLEKAKIPFRVVIPDIDELIFDNLPPKQRVQKISQAKAKFVANNNPESVIIAADTMDEDEMKNVHHKPTCIKEGLEMAMHYSGRSTICYTGVCMIHPEFGEIIEVSQSKIKMQKFSKEEVEKLIDDKFLLRAGALGVTEETAGFTLVESLCGSYTCICGLPMEIVRKYLKKWKVS